MIAFLRDKLAGVSARDLVFSQIEAIVLWLVGGLPGAAGFASRAAAYKMLCARLDGFCWVQPGVTVVQANRLFIGRHFGCNSGSYINAVGGIRIGDYVLIGSNVTISSGMHSIDGRHPPIFARPPVPKEIVIGDDVWIGAGAVIMPGVTLGKGSVIGANAVVTADTQEYSVNVGAPARLVRFREERV